MSLRDRWARLGARLSSSRVRGLGLGAALAVGLGLVLTGTSMELSGTPQFCGSCHIMKPYYESWKQSTHRNIACVDCHIPPGVTAEIRKKYEALSMVARYFTGTYGTNPWTEIDDASCLSCHERRLLAGRELFGGVLFDHTAHLGAMRRGKTLRCTSCHSQIVQGSHIAVTSSTCILCHFKGQTPGEGTARCTLCHTLPETGAGRGDRVFDHADAARFGMECTWCHASPRGSDGAVPRERCLTCHNQADRLGRYEETDLLHRVHVTEHKVDCLNCHLEIQHVGTPHPEQAAGACGSCHQTGHGPQVELYGGIGGRGIPPMPSPMFLAGVRCEGCHLDLPGIERETRRASEISCMSCHGPTYRAVYLSWKDGLERRTRALGGQLERTAREIAAPAPPALADARFNYDLVVRGRGVHNVDYALALLGRAHSDLNDARRARGLQALPLPWAEAPYASPCFSCHQGAESRSGAIFGRSFRHEPHVLRARLDCATCHRDHEERARGEIVRFDAAGCESCHHRETKAGCADCHAGIRAGKVESPRGPFDHAFHLDDAGQGCADCHELAPGKPVRLREETCAGCHG